MPSFTTGSSILPDVGTLSYNGCVFSPYFVTSVNGVAVQDNANWTVKYMEFTLTVEGYVTLGDDDDTIDDAMEEILVRLSKQAGQLIYQGRGFADLVVNQPGGVVQDVAWGPIPKVIDFQPLGAGRSAKVKWTVTTRIPEATGVGGRLGPVLQFNEETTVKYDSDGFSSLSIKGTLEVPLTRATVNTRTMTRTVDDFRQQFLNGIVSVGGGGIDLTRFRVTERDFNISRDKRTMEWSFAAEEIPYQGFPPGITDADGTFDLKKASAGIGLMNWLCTMRCTYTVANNQARRLAWVSFLALMQIRMGQSVNATIPVNAPQQNPNILAQAFGAINPTFTNIASLLRQYRQYMAAQQPALNNGNKKAWIIDFGLSEGLYRGSKRITFTVTWRLISTLAQVLQTSGVWQQSGLEKNKRNWAIAMQSISGSQSWLANRLDPNAQAIIDFGG